MTPAALTVAMLVSLDENCVVGSVVTLTFVTLAKSAKAVAAALRPPGVREFVLTTRRSV
jgi:hypothetical protein